MGEGDNAEPIESRRCSLKHEIPPMVAIDFCAFYIRVFVARPCQRWQPRRVPRRMPRHASNRNVSVEVSHRSVVVVNNRPVVTHKTQAAIVKPEKCANERYVGLSCYFHLAAANRLDFGIIQCADEMRRLFRIELFHVMTPLMSSGMPDPVRA